MSAVVMPTEDGISKVGKDMVFKKKLFRILLVHFQRVCEKKKIVKSDFVILLVTP